MRVVLLLGSSTAGKSTLSQEMVIRHNWESDSGDKMKVKVYLEDIQKLKPKALSALKEKGLIAKLAPLMTTDEIVNFSLFEPLSIAKRNISSERFSSVELPELDSVLKKAGFIGDEAVAVARDLRAVAEIGNAIFMAHRPPTVLDIMDRVFDETFSKDKDPEACIILDLVPDEIMGTAEFIKYFEQRAQRYRDENPANELITSTVFAFCDPVKLGERMEERNRKAAESKTPEEKREDIYTFEQLTMFVTLGQEMDPNLGKHKFSKNELFELVTKHAKASRESSRDAIFIESLVDPDALSQDPESGIQSEKPRIGSKKVITAYERLVDSFGFTPDQESGFLRIRSGLTFDAVINTGAGNRTPAEISDEVLAKLGISTPASGLGSEVTDISMRSSTARMGDLGINVSSPDIGSTPTLDNKKTQKVDKVDAETLQGDKKPAEAVPKSGASFGLKSKK